MFREVVLPGFFNNDGDFIFYDFRTFILELPYVFEQGINYYGVLYGRNYGGGF